MIQIKRRWSLPSKSKNSKFTQFKPQKADNRRDYSSSTLVLILTWLKYASNVILILCFESWMVIRWPMVWMPLIVDYRLNLWCLYCLNAQVMLKTHHSSIVSPDSFYLCTCWCAIWFEPLTKWVDMICIIIVNSYQWIIMMKMHKMCCSGIDTTFSQKWMSMRLDSTLPLQSIYVE